MVAPRNGRQRLNVVMVACSSRNSRNGVRRTEKMAGVRLDDRSRSVVDCLQRPNQAVRFHTGFTYLHDRLC